MEKGFNTDIQWDGSSYHVQTEDWGRENPFVVTRVFKDGAVMRSLKTPYSEVFSRTSYSDPQAIRRAMHSQHEQILDWLISGQA